MHILARWHAKQLTKHQQTNKLHRPCIHTKNTYAHSPKRPPPHQVGRNDTKPCTQRRTVNEPQQHRHNGATTTMARHCWCGLLAVTAAVVVLVALGVRPVEAQRSYQQRGKCKLPGLVVPNVPTNGECVRAGCSSVAPTTTTTCVIALAPPTKVSVRVFGFWAGAGKSLQFLGWFGL